MSQENVALKHRPADAFNRRDLDAMLELMDADVEILALEVEIEGAYHGHAGVRRWWKGLIDAMPDVALEDVEVRDLGHLTLAGMRLRSHGARSDTPTDMPLWILAEGRDGHCVWWQAFGTETEALEAVGLRE